MGSVALQCCRRVSLHLFFPDTANQVKFNDRINAGINQIADMGFLRRRRGTDDRFEVTISRLFNSPILK